MSSIKLEDLLAMISDENLHAEISSGQPVGKEQL
jgi:antitoxin component of MazEF toxin-antitoxin module